MRRIKTQLNYLVNPPFNQTEEHSRDMYLANNGWLVVGGTAARSSYFPRFRARKTLLIWAHRWSFGGSVGVPQRRRWVIFPP